LKGERKSDVRICFDQSQHRTGLKACCLPLLVQGTEAACLLQPGSTAAHVAAEQHQPAFVNVPQYKV